MSGFVRLDREAFDHPLLQDHSRFYAWFWLVSNACWRARDFDDHGKTIRLEEGQLSVTVRQLADAWGWSKSAVDRFLTRLETETMIERKAGHRRMVLTICNWAKYNGSDERERDKSGTRSGTRAGQERDINKQGNQDTIILPPTPQGGKTRSASKSRIPSDWRPPAIADLTPQARDCASQWPDKAYSREAEAFVNWWASEGKAKADWRLTWCIWVTRSHDKIMRGQSFSGGRFNDAPASPSFLDHIRQRQGAQQ